MVGVPRASRPRFERSYLRSIALRLISHRRGLGRHESLRVCPSVGIDDHVGWLSVAVNDRVDSERQLARLLQIGIVLEEIVEVRSFRHYQSLPDDEREDDERIEALLSEAQEESAEHRRRLEDLLEDLDAATVPFEQIERLVEDRYGQTKPTDFDSLLYDQLHGEESAYKFYDDLIAGIEASDAEFSIDRYRLISTLEEIREEEAEGVEEVIALMGDQP